MWLACLVTSAIISQHAAARKSMSTHRHTPPADTTISRMDAFAVAVEGAAARFERTLLANNTAASNADAALLLESGAAAILHDVAFSGTSGDNILAPARSARLYARRTAEVRLAPESKGRQQPVAAAQNMRTFLGADDPELLRIQQVQLQQMLISYASARSSACVSDGGIVPSSG